MNTFWGQLALLRHPSTAQGQEPSLLPEFLQRDPRLAPETFFHPGTSKHVCWCLSPIPHYECRFSAFIFETNCLRR